MDKQLRSLKVRRGKITQISIFWHKDDHVAKNSFISRGNYSVGHLTPHRTAKIPLKEDIHMNLTLRESLPFTYFLPHDPSLIRCSLLSKTSRKGL